MGPRKKPRTTTDPDTADDQPAASPAQKDTSDSTPAPAENDVPPSPKNGTGSAAVEPVTSRSAPHTPASTPKSSRSLSQTIKSTGSSAPGTATNSTTGTTTPTPSVIADACKDVSQGVLTAPKDATEVTPSVPSSSSASQNRFSIPLIPYFSWRGSAESKQTLNTAPDTENGSDLTADADPPRPGSATTSKSNDSAATVADSAKQQDEDTPVLPTSQPDQPRKGSSQKRKSTSSAAPSISDASAGPKPEPAPEPAPESDPAASDPPPTSKSSTAWGWYAWYAQPGNPSDATHQKPAVDSAPDTSTVAGPDTKSDASVGENTVKTAGEQPVTGATGEVASKDADPTPDAADVAADEMKSQPPRPWNWFTPWGTGQGPAPAEGACPDANPQPDGATKQPKANDEVPRIDANENAKTDTTVPPGATPGQAKQPAEGPPFGGSGNTQADQKDSSWGFWFRRPEKSEDSSSKAIVGELAVSNTPSQSRPAAAQLRQEATADKKKAVRGKASAKNAPAVGTGTTSKDATSVTAAATAATSNLLIPHFDNIFPPNRPQSYWQQARHFLVGDSAAVPHLSLTRTTPTIRKAVSIGVHGWFPPSIVSAVIGQPTGTSIRFANNGAAAIEKWAQLHGHSCEIEEIALDGAGVVEDRVEELWKLLLNWVDHVKEADFVLMTSHSQGVPVSVMLISRLIREGYLRPNARIGLCAMAGINLGPFPELNARLWGKSGLQLFDFSKADSAVSLAYREALGEVLEAGVKITYVGSMDDPLVPLHSAVFLGVSHPHIYRAVFVGHTRIDPELTTKPNFLTKLLAFTFKLLNMGVTDHGFIRELAPYLPGSYTGNGHSLLYDDPKLYNLAIRFALETNSMPGSASPTSLVTRFLPNPNFVFFKPQALLKSASPAAATATAATTSTPETLLSPSETRPRRPTPAPKPVINLKSYPSAQPAPSSSEPANPYILPWALRGVLEEDLARKELRAEVQELYDLFPAWEPSTKFKGLQYKIDAIRSRL